MKIDYFILASLLWVRVTASLGHRWYLQGRTEWVSTSAEKKKMNFHRIQGWWFFFPEKELTFCECLFKIIFYSLSKEEDRSENWLLTYYLFINLNLNRHVCQVATVSYSAGLEHRFSSFKLFCAGREVKRKGWRKDIPGPGVGTQHLAVK